MDSAVKFAYYQYNIRGAKGMLLDGVVHNGILIPAAALLLFGYIILMEKFSNKYVNLIASIMFGIYLIHDSALCYFIWDKIFRVPSQYQSVFFPLFAIGTGITVFVAALACSMLGAAIMHKLFHSIRKMSNL